MSNPSARLVFVGAATIDAIALVPEFPAGDHRVAVDALEFAGGGPAATAAVAAARLGHRPSFVGTVGADAEGERVLAGLRDEGVDVSGVERVADVRTGASVVLVHDATAVRAITSRPVVETTINDAGRDLIRGADWVHVDHIGWPALRRLPAVPRLSVDAGNPIEGYTPAGVALHVPTEEALRTAYGSDSLDELLDSALTDGAQTVVATRGADGCVAASSDGRRASAPGVDVDALSTLGAGDVFHGALLAAIAHGFDLDTQLAYANTAAALSCNGLDGRSAIPDHETVLNAIDHPTRSTA